MASEAEPASFLLAAAWQDGRHSCRAAAAGVAAGWNRRAAQCDPALSNTISRCADNGCGLEGLIKTEEHEGIADLNAALYACKPANGV